MNLTEHLSRTEVSKMKAWELDAGFALAIGLQTRDRSKAIFRPDSFSDEAATAEVLRDGEWKTFSPTTSWEDFRIRHHADRDRHRHAWHW